MIKNICLFYIYLAQIITDLRGFLPHCFVSSKKFDIKSVTLYGVKR